MTHQRLFLQKGGQRQGIAVLLPDAHAQGLDGALQQEQRVRVQGSAHMIQQACHLLSTRTHLRWFATLRRTLA